jgi:hypothetical protein
LRRDEVRAANRVPGSSRRFRRFAHMVASFDRQRASSSAILQHKTWLRCRFGGSSSASRVSHDATVAAGRIALGREFSVLVGAKAGSVQYILVADASFVPAC